MLASLISRLHRQKDDSFRGQMKGQASDVIREALGRGDYHLVKRQIAGTQKINIQMNDLPLLMDAGAAGILHDPENRQGMIATLHDLIDCLALPASAVIRGKAELALWSGQYDDAAALYQRLLDGSSDALRADSLRRQFNLARRAADGEGSAPDVLLIGAQKAGTTSLAAFLLQHPDVVGNLYQRSELHLYDVARNYLRGPAWHRAYFPGHAPGDDRLRFTKCPRYIFHPGVAARVAENLPTSTRIIAVLRDPVQRAASHYRMMIQNDPDRPCFADLIRSELDVINDPDPEQVMRNVDRFYGQTRDLTAGLVARGLYVQQLRRYQRHSFRNMLVLEFSDVEQFPEKISAQIWSFLDLPPIAPQLPHERQGAMTMLDADILERLYAFYRPFNELLQSEFGIGRQWNMPRYG